MGFKEMSGNITQTSFWNFDALFTPQDHPVREMQDTFFINKNGKLPDKKIVDAVRKSHEGGLSGSKGWGYKWDIEESKKMIIRVHTTCLSAQTLSKLKEEDLPAKFFAIGWNFRNETVDWNHGFELLQTEGIVVDPNANFQHLLGYLKQFAEKMGFKKIRFRPAYFPYTEPSVEGDVWNEEKQEWVELIAAGIFRPEVTEALLGKPIPVLAWGPGFGRMLMSMFNLKDIRELNENNLTKLRKMKHLIK
jgi:phenylalanyl-tRNA synthetase alpha chain